MLMIRKALYHPRTATTDAEHNRETIIRPADHFEEGPTKLDTVIKYVIIIVMLIMTAFVIWNLNMFQHLSKGPFRQITLPSGQKTRCEQVDHD